MNPVATGHEHNVRQSSVTPRGIGLPVWNETLGKHEKNVRSAIVGGGRVFVEVLWWVLNRLDHLDGLGRRKLTKIFSRGATNSTNTVGPPARVRDILFARRVPKGNAVSVEGAFWRHDRFLLEQLPAETVRRNQPLKSAPEFRSSSVPDRLVTLVGRCFRIRVFEDAQSIRFVSRFRIALPNQVVFLRSFKINQTQ